MTVARPGRNSLSELLGLIMNRKVGVIGLGAMGMGLRFLWSGPG